MAASRIKEFLQLNVKRRQAEREAVRRYQEMLVQQQLEAGKKLLFKKLQQRCAKTIQGAARVYLHRCRQHRAAVTIQSWVRCKYTERQFTRIKFSVSRLQRTVREWIRRRRQETMERFQRMLADQKRDRKVKLLRAKIERRCASRIQIQFRSYVQHKRVSAVIKLQSAYRRVISQRLLERLKHEHQWSAATVIQSTFRMHIARRRYVRARAGVIKLQAFIRGSLSRRHVFEYGDFKRRAARMELLIARWKIENWTTTIAARRVRRKEASFMIQKTWRMYSARLRMVHARKCAIRVQSLVRGIQSRKNVLNFLRFKSSISRIRVHIARWVIVYWCQRQITRYQSKRDAAATSIQSLARMVSCREKFKIKRQATVLIQARFRGMVSRSSTINFYEFRWRAGRSRLRLAMWRIQTWIMHYVTGRRQDRAAARIQSLTRMCSQRRKFLQSRLAATQIQSLFRGVLYRRYMFDFFKYKLKRQHYVMKMAKWKLQSFFVDVVRRRRLNNSSAVIIQKNVRKFVARKHFLLMRVSAISIQKVFRGAFSRRHVHDHSTFRLRMSRLRALCAAWRIQLWTSRQLRLTKARRSALIRAKWRRLSYRLLQNRLDAVSAISKVWRGHKLRSELNTRVTAKRINISSATRIQQWWQLMKLKMDAKDELIALRQAQLIQSRQLIGLQKMKEFLAALRINHVVFTRVIRVKRARSIYDESVRRVQSWWRGMLVRLHEKREAVTEQRKKLSTMTLVTSDHPSGDSLASSDDRSIVQDISKPLTLGARLEMALHMLLHGKRLQDMLFASHTIEMCTRYSRECAWKCVQLKISNTIFAAIRGLNRSRPHVELLHQLLLVLVNLTSYQRKESKNYAVRPAILANNDVSVDQDDLRAVDALIDLIHVHRDMHVIFVLASRILKHYLLVLKPHTATSKEAFHQWNEAHRRLRALHELLTKKMQVAAWTAKVQTPGRKSAPTPDASNSSTNVLAKINPKTAVSLTAQLLKVME